MPDLRALAEVQADIQACDDRFAAIDAEIERLKNERREVGQRRYEFVNEESFVRSCEAAGGFHVKWINGDHPYGHDFWYVEKVTAKLILLRYGYEYDSATYRYHLDGECASRRLEKIDIQATFGQPTINAEIWAQMKPQREASAAAIRGE